MEEIWKPVNGYSKYLISNLGRVKNIKLDNVLSGCKMRGGYIKVKLMNNNSFGYKAFLLHRLVAEHFIPNPDNKSDVDHINGDKSDNRTCVLRWATHKENCQSSADRKTWLRKVSVKQINIETKEEIIYERITDVANKLNVTPDRICKLLDTNKSYSGFIFNRLNPIEPDIKYKDEIWVNTSNSIYSEINIFSRYQVSNYGRIKGWYGKILKLNKATGVETIKLVNNDKTIMIKVHRLVLMAFNIPNPNNYKEVDHIDSNYMNNKLNNLQWANREIQLANLESRKKNIRGIIIKTINITNNTEITYPCMTIAALELNISIAYLKSIANSNILLLYNSNKIIKVNT